MWRILNQCQPLSILFNAQLCSANDTIIVQGSHSINSEMRRSPNGYCGQDHVVSSGPNKKISLFAEYRINKIYFCQDKLNITLAKISSIDKNIKLEIICLFKKFSYFSIILQKVIHLAIVKCFMVSFIKVAEWKACEILMVIAITGL